MSNEPPPTESIPEQRLVQIAQRKLRTLGIQCYFAGGILRGRLQIDPLQFTRLPGGRLDSAQNFVVQGHDRFWLAKPSLLRFIGPVLFFDETALEKIIGTMQHRWKDLLDRTEAFMLRVRRYFPDATHNVEDWTVNASIQDAVGSVGLRVISKQNDLWLEVNTVDSHSRAPDAAPIVMQLPEDPATFDQRSLDPILKQVRLEQHETREEVDGSALSIDLSMVSPPAPVEPQRKSTPPPAPSESPKPLARVNITRIAVPASDDALDLDLDTLLTGDLSKEAPDLEPVPLDEQFLSEVAEDTDDIGESEIPQRLPRIPVQNRSGVISWEGHAHPVRIENANLGGLFASLPDTNAPAVNTTVTLSGFGPFAINARVVHERSGGEAKLFGTGEGVGLAFSDDLAPAGTGSPLTLVLLSDPLLAGRVASALIEVGSPHILVDNLVAAAVALRRITVSTVIVEQMFDRTAWSECLAALDLVEQKKIRGFLIHEEPAHRLPANFTGISTSRITPSTFR